MSVDEHRLQPLLAPRSIALVGASSRYGSVGEMMVRQLIEGGYTGDIYPVNPRYQELNGLRCYGSLGELPAGIELTVLNLAGHRIEATLNESLGHGTKAFVIFDPCRPPEDTSPSMVERLRALARETGIPICGANGMGYSNFDARCFVGMWVQPEHPPGPVTLIAHSGSVFCFANAPAPNYFNLSVSLGQELGTSLDEYMDYSLSMPTTRAIALFVETIRNPDGFRAALARAREKEIPVVVCKLGRTEAGTRQALSHTGAIAGDGDAFDALLEHYDAIKVDSLDQLLSTATLLASPRRPTSGGFTMFTDSGGLCGLAADRGGALGVEFAPLGENTEQRLGELMPLTTPANPLDAMVLAGPGFLDTYRKAHEIMLADPHIGLYCVDSLNDDRYDTEFMTGDAALELFPTTEKPMFLMSSYTGFPQGRLIEKCRVAGAPFIIGLDNALVAARCFLTYHERLREHRPAAGEVDAAIVERWRAVLDETPVLGEHQSLALFRDMGISVIDSVPAESVEAALDAAETLGYPVALKTAEDDIHHKSDVGGVFLGLKDAGELRAAHDSLSSRLGPKMLVSGMADAGVEMALGMFTDPTAGPVMVLGPGGTLVELFDERGFAIPPVDPGRAGRLLAGLRIQRVLEGVRGNPAADIDALARALSRFSLLCAALGDRIVEIDINPLIVGPRGAVAVDGLVVGHRARTGNQCDPR